MMSNRLGLLVQYGDVFLASSRLKMTDMVSYASGTCGKECNFILEKYQQIPEDVKNILVYISDYIASEAKATDQDLFLLCERMIDTQVNGELNKKIFSKKLQKTQISEVLFHTGHMRQAV